MDDEFASRIATASHTDSVKSFLNRLRKKWNVRSIQEDKVLEMIKEYDAEKPLARKFLRTVRNNPALVVLEMKNEYYGDQE